MLFGAPKETKEKKDNIQIVIMKRQYDVHVCDEGY
jgi:hypothetical protein